MVNSETPTLPDDIADTVRRALAEDLGSGDLTSGLVPEATRAFATVVSREPAVICGTAWFDAVYSQLDPGVRVRWEVEDGERVAAGQSLCRIEGPARPILTGERTALNFLQTLSGTATSARDYADAAAGTACRVLDTRKTLPGLRSAQKYAVRCGGCHNHRLGLFDGILIKENHLIAIGGIDAAVAAARDLGTGVPVEVEVENLAEVGRALEAGADRLLLDNFDLEALRAAVAMAHARSGVSLEASGNVALENVGAIAATGVDFVSVGGLTKHVRAVDLSMRFKYLT